MKVEPHQGDGPPDHGPPDAGPDVEATPPISESQQKEEHQDLNFGAVSGFFSGFAAAVQSTVSNQPINRSLIVLSLRHAFLVCRVRDW